MPLPKRPSSQADSIRDMKHRVLTCLNKLSDRDTYSSAATELESIAKALSHDSIPPFISSIAATDASDKSPVRKQCVRLISLLSEAHGNALSPYLSKILSAVVRRLRDPDSAVRSACIDAAGSISSHITKPTFTSILKPLIDSLVTEQDQNSQIGAALCLASAIDSSPDPAPLYLKKLLPRLEKLLKSQSFKAKPALLTLIGSIIGAGGASSQQVLKNLVPCLVQFISNDDWAARKAAAEALEKLALAERHSLSEFKSDCLRTFEAKRFDKVKVARETMNQMVEAWKQIGDVGDEASAPPEESKPSSKEDATDERYPPGSKISGALQGKKNNPASRSALPNGANMTTVRKRGSLGSNDKKIGPAMLQRLERKKPIDWNIEVASPHTPSTDVVCKDGPKSRYEKVAESDENDRNRFVKPEVKRALFNKNDDDRIHKLGVFKGSRVVPCLDENSGSTVVVSNVTEDIYKNQKESEVLSSIRKQLVQIENQQSSLLDLLQKFIGSSQNGMHSLETRVHGLELALDEISSDLAVSTRRKSSSDSERTTCCKLPVAEFLSSKFWKRADDRHSTSQFLSTNGSPSLAAVHSMRNKKGKQKIFKPENRRFRLQGGGGGGFIVNPLAEIHSDPMGILQVSSGRVSKNIHDAL